MLRIAKIRPFYLIFLLLLGQEIIAQSGSKYAVRFNAPDFEKTITNTCVFSFQLEIKALEGESPFRISDQNYRFSFPRNILINPRIIQELEVSGITYVPNDYYAFYDPHNLNGSVDTVISYNVVLAGGDGLLIDDNRWYPIGRVAFDVISNIECYELKWHSHDPYDFPPTFVGEKDSLLFELDEGSYDNLALCDACPFPIELGAFEVYDLGCT